jgi:hypothetical protein
VGEQNLNDGSVGLPDSPPQPSLNLFQDLVMAQFRRRQAWLPPPRAATPSDSEQWRPPFSAMTSRCRYFVGADKTGTLHQLAGSITALVKIHVDTLL